jgi:hypothetical protein
VSFTSFQGLASSHGITFQLIIVPLGMGSGGKTQLALEYWCIMKDSRDFRANTWPNGSSHNAVHRLMVAIAKRLLPAQTFDNSCDTDIFSGWTDRWLLVTSRCDGSKELSQVINRMEQDEDSQILFLQDFLTELAAAGQVLARLGNLLLAIDQACGYTAGSQLPYTDFMNDHKTWEQHIMHETPQTCRVFSPGMEETKSLSPWTTWEMSLPLLGVDEEHLIRSGVSISETKVKQPVST